MKITPFFLVLALLGLIACKKGKNDPDSCNGKNTRREIKLVIDPAAGDVDTLPIPTTVDSLGSLELISADSETGRQEIEKKVFRVRGKVHKVSKHRDGDWKVKLISDNENYLNCEVPNPGCAFAGDSPFYDQFVTAHAFVEAHEKELEGQTVTITGVAFIDLKHPYARNAAENEIELHPILSITY